MTTLTSQMRAGDCLDIVILIPVLDDWASVRELILQLDEALLGWRSRIVIVDDGSVEPCPLSSPVVCDHLVSVDVIELRGNLGHQRAIACGLAFSAKYLQFRAIVVMDGDGEDAAADVPRLLSALAEADDRCVVFAERTKRSESRVFRVGYRVYKRVHRALTGISVRVGNFSVIPRSAVSRLVISPDLWNHYAAAVFRSRTPMRMVATERGTRIAGESRMNFVSLAVHGLSAMAVFGDRVAVRLLVSTVALIAMVAGLAGLLVAGDALTSGRDFVPNDPVFWLLALGLMMQLVALLMVFVFVVLADRSQREFVPLRDSEIFVSAVRSWEMNV